jgi:hypothetical protein
MAPTEEERQAKLATLVPSLPAEDWGAKAEAKPEAIPPGRPEDRLDGLEADKLDGVSDDEDDEDEDEDELEGEGAALAGDFDMAGEMDDFLKFTRDALGISEAQYGEILESRAERGGASGLGLTESALTSRAAFVPKKAKAKAAADLPPVPDAMRPSPAALRESAQAARNPNLDSFDALMAAMSAQLHTKREPPPSAAAPKPAPKTDGDDVAMDEDAELDAELAGLLERDPKDAEAEAPADYGLIKNFLESYRSQGGAAGPVSTLAGRLGAPLPGSRA